ncbi:MAG: hypothetical protein ABL907_20420, partial [Hyphomicrobium sp.]
MKHRLGHLIPCVLGILAFSAADANATIGCSTPTSNTTYYHQAFQTCGGAAVYISNSTLSGQWDTNNLATFACNSSTAATLRYK